MNHLALLVSGGWRVDAAVGLCLVAAAVAVWIWGSKRKARRLTFVPACLLLALCGAVLAFRHLGAQRLSISGLVELGPIDAHVHIYRNDPAFSAMLDRLHMRVLDILYVDDHDRYHADLDRQRQDAWQYIAARGGRAQLCTTFDPFRMESVGFPKETIRGLEADFERGVPAVKLWKNVGMELRVEGRYVLPDDPRLEPVYRLMASRNKTLIAHWADPDAEWVQGGEKTAYQKLHSEWDMSQRPDAPTKRAILDAAGRMLASHPALRVIGAHFGSMGQQLDELAADLDAYPNFAVDTAARFRVLAMQPREKVRAFLLKYQDRILYGSDLRSEEGADGDAAAWEREYRSEWRYLATDEVFRFQGIEVRGLNLPRPVLKKLYHGNAIRWIPGLWGNT